MRLDPDRFAAVVAGTIKAAISGLAERVKALEDRGVIHGKDGAPGPQGERGEAGAPGKDGKDGQDGFPGVDGREGPQGPPGPAGEPGENGRDGRDGLAGVPGPAGEKGLDGRDGINGKDGADGLHGKDGLGFDDLTVEYDGERTFTWKFTRGDQVKSFPFKMPVVLYRKLWEAEREYDTGDSVTWGGSQWIALKASRGIAPDSPNSDQVWALAVMRGRQGKQGAKGDPGIQGKQGPMGPQGRNGY